MTAAVRRSVPSRLVPTLVLARARMSRLRRARWDAARNQMRFVLGDDLGTEPLDDLARRHLVRAAWVAESRFHPELATHQHVDRASRTLRLALSRGKRLSAELRPSRRLSVARIHRSAWLPRSTWSASPPKSSTTTRGFFKLRQLRRNVTWSNVRTRNHTTLQRRARASEPSANAES